MAPRPYKPRRKSIMMIVNDRFSKTLLRLSLKILIEHHHIIEKAASQSLSTNAIHSARPFRSPCHSNVMIRDVVVVDHHDISDHLPFRIYPERLTLLPVNIGLRKTPDRMGHKVFLPG